MSRKKPPISEPSIRFGGRSGWSVAILGLFIIIFLKFWSDYLKPALIEIYTGPDIGVIPESDFYWFLLLLVMMYALIGIIVYQIVRILRPMKPYRRVGLKKVLFVSFATLLSLMFFILILIFLSGKPVHTIQLVVLIYPIYLSVLVMAIGWGLKKEFETE